MRNFTKLAAHEQAPRFLRFLRMVSVADGAPLPRNQCMVLQALSEREAALLLFKTPEGRKELAPTLTLTRTLALTLLTLTLTLALTRARTLA